MKHFVVLCDFSVTFVLQQKLAKTQNALSLHKVTQRKPYI